jgi:hypothetical protein
MNKTLEEHHNIFKPILEDFETLYQSKFSHLQLIEFSDKYHHYFDFQSNKLTPNGVWNPQQFNFGTIEFTQEGLNIFQNGHHYTLEETFEKKLYIKIQYPLLSSNTATLNTKTIIAFLAVDTHLLIIFDELEPITKKLTYLFVSGHIIYSLIDT